MSEGHVRTAQVKGKVDKKKKISAAFYSEQTSDKTWQGQGEKEQSRCGNLLQIHHTQAALIHLKEDSQLLYQPCTFIWLLHLVLSTVQCSYIVDVELTIENNTISQSGYVPAIYI